VSKTNLALSILDEGLNIKGDLESNGEVIIKGEFEGTIKAETLVIYKTGTVEADCDVESAIIGGVYNGNLRVSGVMKILKTGKCSGKVFCKDMVVENGSTMNASVDCSTS